MNLRKISSLTALISFVLLMVTSIVLYIVPAGRVAYWANWTLWSLTKEDWAAVHTNLGFLLLIAILLHIVFNWKPMLSYLKNRSRQLRIFTPDFSVSLVVSLLVFFGTLGGLPPFSSVLDLSASIKDEANRFYGEPPYGHAEMSPLASFAEKVNVDLTESLERLKQAGIKVENSKQTLTEIAAANQIAPNRIYQVIKPELQTTAAKLPEAPPGGTGNMRLADLCADYLLDQGKLLARLQSRQVSVALEKTIKENAAQNDIGPHELYEIIRELAYI